MQRPVVTAHRLVARVHQGKAFLRYPEQRGRREKTCSHCVISLDIQAKARGHRAENEIHQAKVSPLWKEAARERPLVSVEAVVAWPQQAVWHGNDCTPSKLTP